MYCRGYKRINQLPSLRNWYNPYKLGSLASQPYLGRPNGTRFDREVRFRSVFCDFVDIADDNGLYSESVCPAHFRVETVAKLLSFLDSQLVIDP